MKGRRRYTGLTAVSLGILPSTGCVRVPPYDQPTNVPVSAIVRRVKCDIWRTVIDRTRHDKYRAHYAFLNKWAAKVHLTMVVDDTASLTPGVTATHPLHNAYDPSLGPSSLGGTSFSAIAQSFSFGVGAGLTTEAVRTEDLAFFLSFSEMRDEQGDPRAPAKYNWCDLPDRMFLDSDLGLEQAVDNALAPIRDELLTPGTHPPIPTSPAVLPTGMFERSLADIQKLITTQNRPLVADTAAERKADIDEAKALVDKAKKFVDDVAKPIADEAPTFVPECARVIVAFKDSGVVAVAEATAVAHNMSPATDTKPQLAEVRKYAKAAEDGAQKALTFFKTCQAHRPDSLSKPAKYDPVDLISHQVNFYVTFSGSVAPQWKLVRVTAPNGTSLASASRKNTNTLIIVFGAPAVAPNGQPGGSVAMNNQILSALIGQNLTPH